MFNLLAEEKEIFANINEQVEKVEKNGKIILTKFFSLREQVMLMHCAKEHHVSLSLDGGYENAERKRALLFPQEMMISEQFNITCFKLSYNKRYLKITHQNVLGTLMSLKIDRSLFGDIVFVEDECYFFVSSDIEPILLLEFNMINKVPVTINRYELTLDVIQNYESKQIIVSSMRLDNLISHVYHLSRDKTKQFIQAGFVYRNYQLVTSPSVKCEINDVISVRKKGKFAIDQFVRNTKSNKFVLNINIPTS